MAFQIIPSSIKIKDVSDDRRERERESRTWLNPTTLLKLTLNNNQPTENGANPNEWGLVRGALDLPLAFLPGSSTSEQIVK